MDKRKDTPEDTRVKRDPLSDPMLTALVEIRNELRGLRADLAAENRRAELLAAIREAIGANVAFSCAELVEGADAELRAVVGEDAAALGRALAKLEGHGVVRLGKDRDGVVWALI
jgi:hypothetical protein